MQLIGKFFYRLKDDSKYVDFTIIITYIILSLIGLVMIYSASMVMSMHENNNPKLIYLSQLRYVIIGFAFVFAMTFFMPGSIIKDKRLHVFLITTIFLILILTHFFGVEVNGRRRWIDIPLAGRIQPSEFFKIALILYMAYIYNRKRKSLSAIKISNFSPLIMVSVISVLVLFNDFGTWVVIISIIIGIVMYSGFPLKIMFKVFGAAILIVSLLVGVRYLLTGKILSGYQLARLETFMHPFENSEGTSYQLTNSLISISHGGITGTGVGNGVMKLGYLPEPHTDFIFAVIAEELGLIGVVIILLLFMILVFKSLHYAYKSTDQFYGLLCIGVGIYISVQVFLNLGGISGLIPLTGIPLPFLSQGGSSFISISIAVGLLSVAAKRINKNQS